MNEHSPLSSRRTLATTTTTTTTMAMDILRKTTANSKRNRGDDYASLATSSTLPDRSCTIASPNVNVNVNGSVDLKSSGKATFDDDNDDDDGCNLHKPDPFFLDIEDAIDRLGMGPFQYRVILACGLCFASDGMEIQLLSFLTVILKGRWRLSEASADSVVSVVFAGALVGSLLLTPLGDRWGRRPVFALVASIISCFGLLTGACTTFAQIAVLRFLVGVGIGGLTVPYDALGEFMPSTFRGPNVLYVSFFWTASSLMVPLLAWLTLGSHADADADATDEKEHHHYDSWRLFVAMCAVPGLFSVVLSIVWVPESPRWLLTKGKHEEALRILREAAASNGRDPYHAFPESTQLIDRNNNNNNNNKNAPMDLDENTTNQNQHHPADESFSLSATGSNSNSYPNSYSNPSPTTHTIIIAPNENENENDDYPLECDEPLAGVPKDDRARYLCSSPKWRMMGILVGVQWYGLSFLYYGAIIAVSITFSSLDKSNDNDENDNDRGRGFEFDYQALFITSSAEVVGLILAILMVNRAGRVATQVRGFVLEGFCLLILSMLDASSESTSGSGSRWHLILLAYGARLFAMTASTVTWLHTAELLPTHVRATGHGFANALGRIGGITCPYVISRDASLQTIGLIMFLVSIVTSVCIQKLPETTGKALGELGGSARHVSQPEREIVQSQRRSNGNNSRNSNNSIDISTTEEMTATGCGFPRPDSTENSTNGGSTSSFELV